MNRKRTSERAFAVGASVRVVSCDDEPRFVGVIGEVKAATHNGRNWRYRVATDNAGTCGDFSDSELEEVSASEHARQLKRLHPNLTLGEIARRTGISRQAVSEALVSSGKVGRPPVAASESVAAGRRDALERALSTCRGLALSRKADRAQVIAAIIEEPGT